METLAQKVAIARDLQKHAEAKALEAVMDVATLGPPEALGSIILNCGLRMLQLGFIASVQVTKGTPATPDDPRIIDSMRALGLALQGYPDERVVSGGIACALKLAVGEHRVRHIDDAGGV